MADRKSDSLKFEELRNKAKKLLQDRDMDNSDYPTDLFELIEELKIHQAELEVQNDELKNAQQEISNLHHEYETLYEFAPCGYITLSSKGIITKSNLKGADLLGVARGNLKTMALSGFVRKDSQNNYFWAFREARPSGEQQTAELALAGQNDETVWVQANIQPDLNEEGSIKQWRITLSDITSRKRAEEALRESEKQYRSLFENIRDAILLADTERRIFGCNPAFESLFGYSLEEIKGRKTSYVYANEGEFQKLGKALQEKQNDSSFLMTVNYKKKNGEVFPGETGGFYLKNGTGNVVGFIGVIRDVSARKQTEELLQAAYEKVETLVQLNVDGLMVLDREGKILFLNPAAAEMLGQEHNELLGEQFGHPLIPGANTEIELLSKSGEVRVVELRGLETEWSGQTAFLVSFRDITERKRAEERIYNLAYYDELTNLPNRRLFHDRLKQVAARSEYFTDGGVVFLMDITRLREVNDTLGQQAGDELIREVALRLCDTVFEEDTVGRVAGGEFMILSQGQSVHDRAYNLGVRILEGIGQRLELSGRLVYPEVNIGFTLFPHMAADPETLIKQADIALSEAQKSASRIQEFVGQEDWISKQFHLEHDLKQALTNEEFLLCYQSQVDFRSSRIVGWEALLRWEHPLRGIVSPGEFIPVLEHTGMIASVDAWVIHRVCKQLKSWQESGIFVKTSVNLSAQELSNDATIEVVRAALEENGVHPESLEIEITETGLMENVELASRILQALSSWGVRVALDDFGKGYSSLSYLQQLAINTIKIDKQFVDGLPENQNSVTLVQTIIAMGHYLGKEVLAEGVEREEQRQKLVELGCDYGQGFLWNRPQPVEKLPFMAS